MSADFEYEFSGDSLLTPEEERVIALLKAITTRLRITRRMPRGKTLERFVEYFSGFSDDRLESFVARLEKSSHAMNKDFKLESIVSLDLVNKLILESAAAQPKPSSEYYHIQVLEV